MLLGKLKVGARGEQRWTTALLWWNVKRKFRFLKSNLYWRQSCGFSKIMIRMLTERPVLLSYSIKLPPPDFYRVAADATKTISFNYLFFAALQIFSVSEVYFDSAKSNNFASYSDNALSFACKFVSCFLRDTKSCLLNLTVASWLHVMGVIRSLQWALGMHFHKEQGKARVGGSSFGERFSAASNKIELEEMTLFAVRAMASL